MSMRRTGGDSQSRTTPWPLPSIPREATPDCVSVRQEHQTFGVVPPFCQNRVRHRLFENR